MKLKKLKARLFGSFSPALNRIVVSTRYSAYVQAVTKEHETAHAAHAAYIGVDTAEDLLLTEFVAWWRDALYAFDLAWRGKGPKRDDQEGRQVLKDALAYLKDPKSAFEKAMIPYHDQIKAYLAHEGSTTDPATFVRTLAGSIQIAKEAFDLNAWRLWESDIKV